jgi:hypothetical protein
MLALLIISYGVGIACIAGIIFAVAFLARACHRLPADARMARAVGLIYVIGSTAFAAQWAWLIITTCGQLVAADGGPGPFGLLAFPFWAGIAALPPLVGAFFFRWIARKTRTPGR